MIRKEEEKELNIVAIIPDNKLSKSYQVLVTWMSLSDSFLVIF
jgi:hypothetical protein